MDIQKLVTAGLTSQQASAYILLIEKGALTPPEAAKHLKLTRTNAYKLLDKLVELNLSVKRDVKNKLEYHPANPLSLATYVAKQRAQVVAKEEAVGSIIKDLLSKYYVHAGKLQTEQFTGSQAVADAYRKQLALREEVYFIHTDADIPAMGFDVMHEIRTTPARHNIMRHGILQKPDNGMVNFESHKRSNLQTYWLKPGNYNISVEWSVTKSTFLIVSYGQDPQAVLITDPLIAGAFLQLWKLIAVSTEPGLPGAKSIQ